MAQDAAVDDLPVEGDETVIVQERRSLLRNVLIWTGRGLALVAALLLLAVVFLHTGPGRQFIIGQVAKFAPASGLSVEVGRIEGSVLWSATFHDVQFRDADNTLFLEVPELDLNWRPFNFPWRGLDVRHLVLTGGTLYAAPQLLPGDPDAPILPDFDIRIARLVIDDLTVAEGMLGEERRVNFRARANISGGQVDLDARGELGGGDVLTAVLLAQPVDDRFSIDLDYRAPFGGLLAELVGAEEDMAVRLIGNGTWTNWEGDLLARQGGVDLLDFDIFQQRGQYRIVGRARPAAYLAGLPAAALGELVDISAMGSLENSLLEGNLTLRGRGIAADMDGGIDLAANAVRNLVIEADLLDPTLFGDGAILNRARLDATLNGGFRDLSILHELRIAEVDAGGMIVSGLFQQGRANYDGTRLTVPLDATIQRIVSGNDLLDPRLRDGTLTGTLVQTGDLLSSDNLAVIFQGLDARLALRADLARGALGLSGPVNARGLPFDGIGTVDAGARIQFALGGPTWQLSADFDGRVVRTANETLANLAGDNIRFDGGVTLAGNAPAEFRRTRLRASKLQLQVDGRVSEGATTLAGSGVHAEYGPFTVEADITGEGPRAQLVFASPLPAAGLRDVRVALAPEGNGFRIETEGGSLLGPFAGLINLTIPDAGPTMIGIERLTVAQTLVSGDLALAAGGVSGVLDMSRGGVDGTITLDARDGGQAFAADLALLNARFGGDTPLSIARGSVNASGFFSGGNSAINGNASLQGLNYGNLFLGRMIAQAEVENGTGTFDAALAGRRGNQFDLQVSGQVAPERIAVAVDGSYAGRAITMPRRAVLLAVAGGGWELQRTQLSFGDGFVLAQGRVGGDGPPQVRLGMVRMPLSLVELGLGELGLGGMISGAVELGANESGRPVGSARLLVSGLTRSGLVLTSRPMDLALVADLSPDLLQARAVMNGEGNTNGRLQARIANLPVRGTLTERLYAGDLFAQFRFNGPAASLWRLAALDLIDITGPLQVAGNVRGTLGQPQFRGSLAGDNLRLRSALTGSDITNTRVRGSFAGSRLELSSFAGTAPNGGTVSGSGTIDLANLSRGQGPRIDVRLAARNADILNLPGMGATITGPLRIVSTGVGGTVAGRLTVNAARWRLGGAAEAGALPNLTVREINMSPDIAPASAVGAPWRYLINANAARGIAVDGMGLDSEWSGNIRLRGTTDDPRIGGEVRIVPRQGFYSFAGTRFEITRGQIYFDEGAAPDPRLDIMAETDASGTDVAVTVTGTASQPEIAFTSVPALPEEELLARLLFGGSITDLSATDALQLGAALASLRGGGGIGPINQLRNAIGLDRLRIVPADSALDRGTSVALGKNLTRRLYGEIITDGRGYNATELEFRVTSWLSLLASLNTLGRSSGALEYSRDY